jgi:hypothetical protein
MRLITKRDFSARKSKKARGALKHTSTLFWIILMVLNWRELNTKKASLWNPILKKMQPGTFKKSRTSSAKLKNSLYFYPIGELG